MIVITGANGQLGRLIVDHLCRLTRDPFVATARDPTKVLGLGRHAVDIRQADFARPSTLTGAFAGATQVLIVSSNAQNYGGDPLAQHRAAIAAAKVSGARRIVYTSHMAASATSAFSPMHSHAATEAMLGESGIKWTALRNGFYASTVQRIIGNALEREGFETPIDGSVNWTSHSDLAEAAAQILLHEGHFEGPTPPLTAPQALDLSAIALLLSAQHGRTIVHRIVNENAYSASLTSHGVPSATVEILLQMFRAARAGEFATESRALNTLLGRPPLSIDDYLKRSH